MVLYSYFFNNTEMGRETELFYKFLEKYFISNEIKKTMQTHGCI